MIAGKLRQRLVLEQKTQTPDGQGGHANAWTVVDALWAEVLTSAGKEFQAAKQTEPTLTHQVRIRFRSDLTASMRFRKGSGVLAINASMDPDDRRRELLVFCTEHVGETP